MERVEVDELGLFGESWCVKAAVEQAHSNGPRREALDVLAGLERRLDLASLDDESLGCAPDVLEGKTRDEREVGVWTGIKHPEVPRVHDERTGDFVLEIPVNGGQPDIVADADPLERTEQTIAVRRKRAVARLPRRGSIR
jgi:hypothetical protein